ncbi:hypothetical protein NDU88_002876 [Pleurodeles waltl]|uniref:Uncharacterized protein n=1 Tax=Pleurodeles waltl TaxID=8319 RepID=A0AAV7SFY6_PLEWA|nr:hypothetical protein NDU88_002876 [Pleurodeles waltl]
MSAAVCSWSVAARRAVSGLWLLRNPDWAVSRALLSLKNCRSCKFLAFLRTLAGQGSSEMGQKSDAGWVLREEAVVDVPNLAVEECGQFVEDVLGWGDVGGFRARNGEFVDYREEFARVVREGFDEFMKCGFFCILDVWVMGGNGGSERGEVFAGFAVPPFLLYVPAGMFGFLEFGGEPAVFFCGALERS